MVESGDLFLSKCLPYFPALDCPMASPKIILSANIVILIILFYFFTESSVASMKKGDPPAKGAGSFWICLIVVYSIHVVYYLAPFFFSYNAIFAIINSIYRSGANLAYLAVAFQAVRLLELFSEPTSKILKYLIVGSRYILYSMMLYHFAFITFSPKKLSSWRQFEKEIIFYLEQVIDVWSKLLFILPTSLAFVFSERIKKATGPVFTKSMNILLLVTSVFFFIELAYQLYSNSGIQNILILLEKRSTYKYQYGADLSLNWFIETIPYVCLAISMYLVLSVKNKSKDGGSDDSSPDEIVLHTGLI